MPECKKSCDREKKCNRKSGRCVNRHGKIGKELDKLSREYQYGHADKICPRRKILNPASGKCVHEDSRIGQKIIDERKEHEFNNKYIKMAEKILSDGYNIDHLIGYGEYGRVYSARRDNKYRAVKVVELVSKLNQTEFKWEITMQEKFAKKNLGPKIYATSISAKNKIGAIEMEQIDGTLDKLLQNPQSVKTLDKIVSDIEHLIEKLCDSDLTHADLHWGNIGYFNHKIPYNKLVFIDFGQSCCAKDKMNCSPLLEYGQLIRTIDLFDMNKKNESYLLKKLKNLYQDKTTFKNPRKNSQRQIGDRHERQHDKYLNVLDKKIRSFNRSSSHKR